MKRGFTLVELLVVLSVFAMMSAIGIPAFQRYGSNIALAQKAEEIKELIKQTYILSQNPNQEIASYISTLSDVNESGQRQVVQRYIKINHDDEEDFKAVKLAKNQQITFSGDSSEGLPRFVCFTDLKTDCRIENARDLEDGWSYLFQITNDNNKTLNIEVRVSPFFDIRVVAI